MAAVADAAQGGLLQQFLDPQTIAVLGIGAAVVSLVEHREDVQFFVDAMWKRSPPKQQQQQLQQAEGSRQVLPIEEMHQQTWRVYRGLWIAAALTSGAIALLFATHPSFLEDSSWTLTLDALLTLCATMASHAALLQFQAQVSNGATEQEIVAHSAWLLPFPTMVLHTLSALAKAPAVLGSDAYLPTCPTGDWVYPALVAANTMACVSLCARRAHTAWAFSAPLAPAKVAGEPSQRSEGLSLRLAMAMPSKECTASTLLAAVGSAWLASTMQEQLGNAVADMSFPLHMALEACAWAMFVPAIVGAPTSASPHLSQQRGSLMSIGFRAWLATHALSSMARLMFWAQTTPELADVSLAKTILAGCSAHAVAIVLGGWVAFYHSC